MSFNVSNACKGTNYGSSNAWEIITTKIFWYKD